MALTEKIIGTMLVSPPLLIGLGLIYEGWRRRRMSRSLVDADHKDIGEVEPGDAPVAIEGQARPAGEETIDAPLTGTDAVRLTTRVGRESKPDADHASKSAEHTAKQSVWKTVYRNREEVPWVVDDGTGRARVDPRTRQGTVEIEPTSRIVEQGETPPPAVDELLLGIEGEWSPDPDERHRYLQAGIEVGEEVFVYGEAVDAGDQPGDVVITAEETPDRFALTDISEQHIAQKWSKGGAVLWLFGGTIPTLVGLILIVALWLS